jgi:replicative DNA helicase
LLDSDRILAMSLPNQYTEQDQKTEKVLLGTLMRGGTDSMGDVLEAGLRPEDFYRDSHQLIYTALAYLYQNDFKIDILTMAGYLRSKGCYEKVGGEAYLCTLEDNAIGYPHAANYARIIIDRAVMRNLTKLGAVITEECSDGKGDVRVALSKIELETDRLRTRATPEAPLLAHDAGAEMRDRRDARMAQESPISGVPTGYRTLDWLTGGFQKTDLIVLGGRPGMGKTAFAINLLINASMPERRETYKELPPQTVLFFSLEMGMCQVQDRIVCQLSGINLLDYRSGKLDETWLAMSEAAIARYESAPFYIDDSGADKGITPLSIKAKVKRVQRDCVRRGLPPLGLVAIDYLQLISPDGEHHNRERAVAEISTSMKRMAKELDLPVLCLSQLNRSGEGAPELSALRDSGVIEQDADLVAFVLRQKLLNPKNPDVGNQASLELKKQRNGPTGVQHLDFIEHCSSFVPATYEEVSKES